MASTASIAVQSPFCVTGEPTCACGQALECSHTAHCPRCGINLHA